MKRNLILVVILLIATFLLSGCFKKEEEKQETFSIGIMLPDGGIGDMSFNDTAFNGLIKARDELGIEFDYKELKDTKTYEKGLEDLTKEGHDLVIALGFNMQEELDKVAKKYPEQQYILIDSYSDVENVTNINFKEEEGSYLIGMLAGMKTKSNKIGFIGGVDNDVINRFKEGFIQGIKKTNPKAKVYVEYANDFADEKKGAKIAESMIKKGVDYIFPVAGLTGIGALKKAEEKEVYSFGVDTDQYFVAKDSVVSSMTKNIDVAVFDAVKEYKSKGKLAKNISLGLKKDGVSMTKIRLIVVTTPDRAEIEKAKKQIIDGTIKINLPSKEGK